MTARETTIARAWALTRGDGLVLGFTDHDAALTFDGVVFRPDRGLSARAIIQGTGLSIDNTEAAGALSDDAITEKDIAAGRWDGAELRLWDVDWTDADNRRLVFRGTLGDVARADGAFRAELRGLAEPLGRATGRVFHPRCSARLGDGSCKVRLDQPGYFVDAVLADVAGARLVLSGDWGHEQGWFTGGNVRVTSGATQGLSAAIKSDRQEGDQRVVELWAELPDDLVTGDRLRVTAGCDKRAETCRMKFLNFLNFRGFPHLPSEDWLIAPGAAGARA